jgi:hypothetical protein
MRMLLSPREQLRLAAGLLGIALFVTSVAVLHLASAGGACFDGLGGLSRPLLGSLGGPA